MVRELTLRQVGGSIRATIPKDMAERLHLEVGDRVLALETDQRWWRRLNTHDTNQCIQ